MQGKRLSQEEQRQIVRAAKVMPIRAVAKQYQVDRNTVRRYVRGASK